MEKQWNISGGEGDESAELTLLIFGLNHASLCIVRDFLNGDN
jgi:hypothetical protein